MYILPSKPLDERKTEHSEPCSGDVEEILAQTVTEGVNSYKPLYDFKGMEFVPFERNEYAQFLVNHWAQETAEKMINLSRTKVLCFERKQPLKS